MVAGAVRSPRFDTSSEVSVGQMLHFFKKYMTKSSLPLKTLGRQNLAAAVYCHITAEVMKRNEKDPSRAATAAAGVERSPMKSAVAGASMAVAASVGISKLAGAGGAGGGAGGGW